MDQESDIESRRVAAEARIRDRLQARRARTDGEEKSADRRPRGLLTGRSRRPEGASDENDRDEGESWTRKFRRGGSDGSRPRTGAKRSVMKAITQLPAYFRLLLGLIADSRVS